MRGLRRGHPRGTARSAAPPLPAVPSRRAERARRRGRAQPRAGQRLAASAGGRPERPRRQSASRPGRPGPDRRRSLGPRRGGDPGPSRPLPGPPLRVAAAGPAHATARVCARGEGSGAPPDGAGRGDSAHRQAARAGLTGAAARRRYLYSSSGMRAFRAAIRNSRPPCFRLSASRASRPPGRAPCATAGQCPRQPSERHRAVACRAGGLCPRRALRSRHPRVFAGIERSQRGRGRVGCRRRRHPHDLRSRCRRIPGGLPPAEPASASGDASTVAGRGGDRQRGLRSAPATRLGMACRARGPCRGAARIAKTHTSYVGGSVPERESLCRAGSNSPSAAACLPRGQRKRTVPIQSNSPSSLDSAGVLRHHEGTSSEPNTPAAPSTVHQTIGTSQRGRARTAK